MVLGTVKLKHRNSTISLSTHGRDVAKELTSKKDIAKEFTVFFFEIQLVVIRNSKLAGPSKSASKWISWHRWITPTVHPEKNSRDIKKTLVSHSKQIGQECTDATSIRLPSRSHNHEPSPRITRRTSRTYFSTVSKMAPFFPKSFLVELGTRPKAGGAHVFNSFLNCVK